MKERELCLKFGIKECFVLLEPQEEFEKLCANINSTGNGLSETMDMELLSLTPSLPQPSIKQSIEFIDLTSDSDDSIFDEITIGQPSPIFTDYYVNADNQIVIPDDPEQCLDLIEWIGQDNDFPMDTLPNPTLPNDGWISEAIETFL